MNIYVCFKIVPDYEAVSKESWKNTEPEFDFVEKNYGCYDEAALETALRLKDSLKEDGKDCHMTAVTFIAEDGRKKLEGSVYNTLLKSLYSVGYDDVCVILPNCEDVPGDTFTDNSFLNTESKVMTAAAATIMEEIAAAEEAATTVETSAAAADIASEEAATTTEATKDIAAAAATGVAATTMTATAAETAAATTTTTEATEEIAAAATTREAAEAVADFIKAAEGADVTLHISACGTGDYHKTDCTGRTSDIAPDIPDCGNEPSYIVFTGKTIGPQDSGTFPYILAGLLGTDIIADATDACRQDAGPVIKRKNGNYEEEISVGRPSTVIVSDAVNPYLRLCTLMERMAAAKREITVKNYQPGKVSSLDSLGNIQIKAQIVPVNEENGSTCRFIGDDTGQLAQFLKQMLECNN